jgi:peptidoglycan/xylan/chitin deacetylase (PgdA/CDA1 family)
MSTPSMRSPEILVTIDYELFGNGLGDLERHLVNPTELALSYFKTNDIKATFFVEFAELMAIEEQVRKGVTPCRINKQFHKVMNQIEAIVRQGHDIQLHYHPQWDGGFWAGEAWQIEQECERLLSRGEQYLTEAILRGKSFLEGIIGGIRENAAVHVFRAGMFQYDRSLKVGRALLNAGIKIDSSMVRGLVKHRKYSEVNNMDLLDYRQPYWRSLDGSQVDDPGGEQSLLEVPVWSVMQPGWKKFSRGRVLNKLTRNRNYTSFEELSTNVGFQWNPVSMLDWLRRRQSNIWDFSLLDGKQLISHFQKAKQFHADSPLYPLVLLGHSKELYSMRAFAIFDRYINRHTNSHWITFSEFYTAHKALPHA